MLPKGRMKQSADLQWEKTTKSQIPDCINRRGFGVRGKLASQQVRANARYVTVPLRMRAQGGRLYVSSRKRKCLKYPIAVS